MGMCQGLISASTHAGSTPLQSRVLSLELFQIIQNEGEHEPALGTRTWLCRGDIFKDNLPQRQFLSWINLPPLFPGWDNPGNYFFGQIMGGKWTPNTGPPKMLRYLHQQKQSGLAGTKCHLPIPGGLASLQSCDLIPPTFPEVPHQTLWLLWPL